MKLSFNQIKELVTGAVRVEEENGSVRLYRFTKEQEELYKLTNQDFYNKTFSTAGIRLLFKTDSKNLFLKVITSRSTSRTYFSFDVFVDGKSVGCMDNFSDAQLPQDYTKADLPIGEASKSFWLGEGVKTVCVYLPWSVGVEVKEISVDDGAFVEALKPQKKLLAYGDSITHGYDALRPSERYIAKLADMLGAEEFNKAIGGEKFFAKLAKLKDLFVPDYITVAYGTNDWSKTDEASFMYNCREFYTNIRQNYPDAKIFAITPIWRKDFKEKTEFGAFEKVEENIRSIVKDIENIEVISGFDFVPKDEKYFADLRLHPNDEGFRHYFENLSEKVINLGTGQFLLKN